MSNVKGFLCSKKMRIEYYNMLAFYKKPPEYLEEQLKGVFSSRLDDIPAYKVQEWIRKLNERGNK